MSTPARKPAGSPGSTGGQFAPTRAGEADVDLAPAQWVQDGVTPHPSGGYVTVEQDGDSVRYLGSDGRLHRDGGPAVELADGTREWYQNGRLHRLGGPAVEQSDGTKWWYQNSKLHRGDGPAFERVDGARSWFRHDRRHRTDGPAVEYPNGRTEYWIDGRELTQAEFEALPPASRV